MASSRSATSSTSGWPTTSRRRAVTARCCSTRCSRRAVSRRPLRRARLRRSLRRRLARPACRCRAGAAAQDRHRRRRPCSRACVRRRRQELQMDRLPERRDRAWPGPALLDRATAAGGSPARSSATSGMAAMRRRCTSRTPPLLDSCTAQMKSKVTLSRSALLFPGSTSCRSQLSHMITWPRRGSMATTV